MILLYLPPYSPDLNPIEEFLPELKAFVKQNWQRCSQEGERRGLLPACQHHNGDAVKQHVNPIQVSSTALETIRSSCS